MPETKFNEDLAIFLIRLALNKQGIRTRFAQDPVGIMKAAGLSDDAIQAVQAGSMTGLLKALESLQGGIGGRKAKTAKHVAAKKRAKKNAAGA